jgi:hypothetical protein
MVELHISILELKQAVITQPLQRAILPEEVTSHNVDILKGKVILKALFRPFSLLLIVHHSFANHHNTPHLFFHLLCLTEVCKE